MKKAFKILIISFFVVLIVITCTVFCLIIKSNNWKKEFESQVNPNYMVENSDENSEEIKELNKKIEEYVTNKEDIDFVSFTPKEVSRVIYTSLSEMTEESGFEISNVYTNPSKNTWEVCVLIRVKDLFKINVWVCTDVSKDNMQTAQLYTTNFKVQGISVGIIFPSMVSSINQGIAEALVTVNENRFVGRKFENIELEDDQLIVKGSLY
jgi:cell division protein FtsX